MGHRPLLGDLPPQSGGPLQGGLSHHDGQWTGLSPHIQLREGQHLLQNTCHMSANPGLGRDPWILTPPPTQQKSQGSQEGLTSHPNGLYPPLSALLPFILTWNSPRWTSRAPSMSHMSCKAPHRVAEHPSPGRAAGDTQRPCHTEACGWRGASSGPGERPPKAGPCPPPPSCAPTAHLSALLQAAAQLLQALSGGAAGRAPGEGPLHVGGAVTQAALDTVALVKLIHLPGAQEGEHCPRRAAGPQTCLPLSPSGRSRPELLSPPQTLTAITPCAGSPAPLECEPTGSGTMSVTHSASPGVAAARTQCTTET